MAWWPGVLPLIPLVAWIPRPETCRKLGFSPLGSNTRLHTSMEPKKGIPERTPRQMKGLLGAT